METTHYGLALVVLLICVEIEAIVCQGHTEERHTSAKHRNADEDLLTKIQLTQKGYIQFLRYIVDVPSMTEYTFCLWLKSNNLTYSHPLLSYSRHEEERLIRVWISPYGNSINLEIHGVHIFQIPTNFKEHRWYHICQSWSSENTLWDLFINGKVKHRGSASKLNGLRIKSGGDIVVGQEYTDFDKGLDDGIEGFIFGFNFVLSATSSGQKPAKYNRKSRNSISRDSTGSFILKSEETLHPRTIQKIAQMLYPQPGADYLNLPNNTLYSSPSNGFHHSKRSRINLHRINNKSSATNAINRKAMVRYIDSVDSTSALSEPHLEKRRKTRNSAHHNSLGMKLVEVSRNCGIGKGAPLYGKNVLISWTKTTVRVFGGAIIKHVKPFC